MDGNGYYRGDEKKELGGRRSDMNRNAQYLNEEGHIDGPTSDTEKAGEKANARAQPQAEAKAEKIVINAAVDIGDMPFNPSSGGIYLLFLDSLGWRGAAKQGNAKSQ